MASFLGTTRRFSRRWQVLVGGLTTLGLWLGGMGAAWALPRLTVVRGTQNWGAIASQLDQSDVNYDVLDQAELTLDRLTGVQVLFLPNLETLSPEEVQTLATWVDTDGGRLIVSGPVAPDPAVREQFRQLVGAYWSSTQTAPVPVVPTAFGGNDWAQSVTATTPITGGNLVPADMTSRLSATWSDGPGRPPAVVSNRNSVYFGWQWGQLNQADGAVMDREWLNAALARFDDLIRADAQVPGAAPVAPPIEAQPINTLEMLAMRQELGNLLGRVQSAILTADASGGEVEDLPAQYQAVVAQAQEVLDNLPDWVQTNQHRRARQAFADAQAGLWRNYPLDRLSTLPEVRAIWLDRGTIVEARSPAGLAAVFDRLAAAGINTVFFETVNAGFPIYPSRVAPAQNPLTRHWDPLKAAVELAHARNMELHAWVWTFAVGNTRHNVLPEISLPRDYIGPVLTQYPDWANRDQRGQLFPPGQPETWLDPANPGVRRYLAGIVQELVQDYGVDGIQLDYIRYPFQNAGSRATWGYGTASRQQFQQLTGVDPQDLDPLQDRSLWTLWTQFRADQVREVVEDLSAQARRLNPQVIMSAAVYSFGENERLQRVQQMWESWVAEGHLDLLVPMTYAENTRRLEQLVKPSLAVVSESPVLFLPSVNLLDLPDVEFLDQMQVVRDLPTGGYSLFATRQLNDTLQNILSQSRVPSSQIPYRNPFGAAAARFEALDQEWQFLLGRDQIWIAAADQEAWLAAVREMQTLLTDLEANPSEAKVVAVRGAIASFREDLNEWMRLEALQRSYRVGTWQNRLTALETLLRYGQQNLGRVLAAPPSRRSPALPISQGDEAAE